MVVLGEQASAAVAAVALAARAAARASLDDPAGVVRLLDTLRKAGAGEQATALAARLPAAGMFELFIEQHEVRGAVPFRAGTRRHPCRGLGLERLGLTPVAGPGDGGNPDSTAPARGTLSGAAASPASSADPIQ